MNAKAAIQTAVEIRNEIQVLYAQSAGRHFHQLEFTFTEFNQFRLIFRTRRKSRSFMGCEGGPIHSLGHARRLTS